MDCNAGMDRQVVGHCQSGAAGTALPAGGELFRPPSDPRLCRAWGASRCDTPQAPGFYLQMLASPALSAALSLPQLACRRLGLILTGDRCRTLPRLEDLRLSCRMWAGPISAAAYVQLEGARVAGGDGRTVFGVVGSLHDLHRAVDREGAS
jgi:hypothetical protein